MVNVLLESTHIFMFVVYGLYFCLFTSMVLCYSLSVLFFVPLAHVGFNHFPFSFFFLVQYQFFTDMHSFKAGVFYALWLHDNMISICLYLLISR